MNPRFQYCGHFNYKLRQLRGVHVDAERFEPAEANIDFEGPLNQLLLRCRDAIAIIGQSLATGLP
jgi:hypothetical protein